MLICWVGSFDLRDEARGTNDVKGGDTEEALGIINTFGLVDLSTDRDSRIDLAHDIESVRDADA